MVDVFPPGGDRIRLVQADRVHDAAPESLHIRFAEHPLRPAFVGKGHDRPVQAPLVEDDLERALGKLLGACLAHAHPIEVGKEARIGIACDGDLRPLNPGEVLELLELPRRRPLEHRVVTVHDQLSPEVGVAVFHRHIPGAGLVRRGREGTRQGCVLDIAVDENILALADVRTDTNRELGVTPQKAVVGHGRGL